jgi:hypothetical protein
LSYTTFDEDESLQIDSALLIHQKYLSARQAAEKLGYQWSWAECPDGVHLKKIDSGTGKEMADLGLRSDKLVALYESQHQAREKAFATLEASQKEHDKAQKLNRATGVGRVPGVVIDILQVIWAQGLMDYYRVVGTHALYAYEAAAKVTFDAPTMATNDVDLLWDVQTRIEFVEVMKKSGRSMLDVLQLADPSFERNEDEKQSAINAQGFSVDFLSRPEPEKLSEAFTISGKEGDVLPVQARNAQKLLDSPPFEQVIVGLDGRMTLMRTIDPGTFVAFKLWMCEQADRDFQKRHRDRMQALAVKALLDEGRLTSRLLAAHKF